MAVGAVVNAVWDLTARRAGKPLWKLLADLTPEELVGLVDFRYLDDALTRDEALGAAARGRARPRRARGARCSPTAIPPTRRRRAGSATTTRSSSRLSREAVADGFTQIKLKVGADLDDDMRRLALAREAVGPGRARSRSTPTRSGASPRRSSGCSALRAARPVLDRGADRARRRARPRGDPRARSRRSGSPPASTRTTASSSSSCCRPARSTSCRSTPAASAGVNENLAILLLAAKFGVPVCPHAGGVGLCEMVQHLAMFDYVAVSATLGRPRDRVRRPPARALRRSLPSSATAGIAPRRAPGLGRADASRVG